MLCASVPVCAALSKCHSASVQLKVEVRSSSLSSIDRRAASAAAAASSCPSHSCQCNPSQAAVDSDVQVRVSCHSGWQCQCHWQCRAEFKSVQCRPEARLGIRLGVQVIVALKPGLDKRIPKQYSVCTITQLLQVLPRPCFVCVRASDSGQTTTVTRSIMLPRAQVRV